MTTEEALLCQIAANPRERLAYGMLQDWYLDNDDGRAEEVRYFLLRDFEIVCAALCAAAHSEKSLCVVEWQRRMRAFLSWAMVPPETIFVSRDFYDRLAAEVESRRDFLGDDTYERDHTLTFRRIPVKVRE